MSENEESPYERALRAPMQPMSIDAGMAGGLGADLAVEVLAATMLLAAFAAATGRAAGTTNECGPLPESEKEDWKTLESVLTAQFSKKLEPTSVGPAVERAMQHAQELVAQVPPERRKDAIIGLAELAKVRSEKEDHKRAGIPEPPVSLDQAVAESREVMKQYGMKKYGQTEEQAGSKADAFLKRQDNFIEKMRADGMSDRAIAEMISDCNEGDRRMLAKMGDKAQDPAASRDPAPKAKTLEEAAREFAKHAPKLPTDSQELAKRPTGHPDGQFQAPGTGMAPAGLHPRGHSTSRT